MSAAVSPDTRLLLDATTKPARESKRSDAADAALLVKYLRTRQ